MNLITIFYKSIQLPKKEALFSLNRISMRDTLVYIFVVIFVLFLPELIHAIVNADVDVEGLDVGTYILQVLVYYPLFIMFIVVAGISLLAAGALLLKTVLNRRLAYQQLWKMTSFAVTVPLIIYTLFNLVQLNSTITNWLPIVIYYILMYKMISVYPKMRK